MQLRKHSTINLLSRVKWFVIDAVLIYSAGFISLFLRFENGIPKNYPYRLSMAMLWIIPIYLLYLLFTKTYTTLWKYAGGFTYLQLGFSSFIAGGVTIVLDLIFIHEPRLSLSVLFLTSVFSFFLMSFARFGTNLTANIDHLMHRNGGEYKRVLVIGAGEAAAWLMSESGRRKIKPVALLDDSDKKQGQYVNGVKVVGKIDDVGEVAQRYRVSEIIIAIPALKKKRFQEVAVACASTKIPTKTVTELQNIGENGTPTIRDLNYEDFLSRNEVELDIEKISGYLKGKTVLVTGGAGSIGSEICRQVMRFSPKKLIVFDIYENTAYELLVELQQKYGRDVPVEVCIGSIRDKARLEEVFGQYKPSVVFHAAAHKHVPLMESAPNEAIKNNVLGTRNVLEAADEVRVERFVILSTDKAVNPTNVMGATKRVAEMMIQCFKPKSGMKCMAVRFGNVLGSHGSVIPLFINQIQNGGPVTVTDPDIKRYFMTIPEAAQLVLEAGGLAQSGAIYVLDMGEQIRIIDVAQQLIRFYGYEPGIEMKIDITGLRPGEKMYEELMTEDEKKKITRTENNMIYVAPRAEVDENVFWRKIGELDGSVEILGEIVDTYRPELQAAG